MAQEKIRLEEIYRDKKFETKTIPGFRFMKDGRSFTKIEEGAIKQYDIKTGKWKDDIFSPREGFNSSIDGYMFSEDEKLMLIRTASEKIYRRSTLDLYYVYNRSTRTLKPLYETAKQRDATFSPDGLKVAFVSANNLFIKDLASGKINQITYDGKKNHIINGAADWVYEEEFSLVRAFEWAPDSKKLAYIRFDESQVKEFTMTHYRGGLYPEYETFKYPKVGEKNSLVNVKIFDLEKGKTKEVAFKDQEDFYIPRIKWTQNPDQLCVWVLNRHQNHLTLWLARAKNGKVNRLMEEKNKYYIDIHDHTIFLKNGNSFLWTSEQDGYNHIYSYDLKGRKVKQITSGHYDVTSFYGIDEKRGKIYYQAAERSPLQRELYSIDLNGKNKKILADALGFQAAQFSSTYDYYVLHSSGANTPTWYAVYTQDGKAVRTLEENTGIKDHMDTYDLSPVEFFDFESKTGITLHGWMIKPPHFRENRKYPVLMFQYSGPGSQKVLDQWAVQNHWWFQYLAQNNYIVACIDGRGTGARGEDFKKMTYLNLGKLETEDQIDAAKYLGSREYIDAYRIGIFGWSYGGYMSTLCMLKGADIFKAGIAVAPVTNWKWYDSIYTERYMLTEKENREGYEKNSPVYFASQLEGAYLLVHGLGDDNVHFQHTAEMANALISHNKQFETYFYPNRNHRITGDNAQLHLFTKMSDFIFKNL
jgi:dipeptidyl-peptidase-4